MRFWRIFTVLIQRDLALVDTARVFRHNVGEYVYYMRTSSGSTLAAERVLFMKG